METSRDNTVVKLRRHISVLRELSNLAAEKLTYAELLDVVVTQVARGVEIDHVKIMRYRPKDGDLIVEAGIGWVDGVVGHATFAPDLASPAGSAFQTGQPTVIRHLPQSTEYRMSPILRSHNIVSVLNAPVQIDGDVWGVLEVDSTVECDFSTDTQEFILIAAAITAGHLRRDRAAHAHETALAEAAIASHKASVLLDELHHRMKNNFQTILTMMKLSGASSDSVAAGAFAKLSQNIIAMSLARDQLSMRQAVSRVNLPSYLRALALRIPRPHESISIEVKTEDFSVEIERAVPLGLIMNELITNSIKHAFPNRSGVIHVNLIPGPGRGELQLIVADNGHGSETLKEDGSGLKLVRALARQIRGRLEIQSSKEGTRAQIVFAMPDATGHS